MSKIFVIDNSVVMSWCFKDETNQYADAVLDKLTEAKAVVPSIWPLEVANVLLVAERQNRVKQGDSLLFLELLFQLPIDIEHDWPEMALKDILALGRSTNLSSYDTAYLLLAIKKRCPLATLDKKLIEAAKHVNVPLL